MMKRNTRTALIVTLMIITPTITTNDDYDDK